MRILLLLSLITFTYKIILAESRLLRFPATNGTEIAFSYGGDLYSVNINGGIARKLTNHKGYESFAHYSPNGTQIAFTAQYDGNTEVYIIPSEGGEPKRLTYSALISRDDMGDRMGPNNIVMCWTPDGQNVVYRSRKQSFNDFVGQLFKVSVNGGLSEQLPIASGGFCSFSSNGKQLAFNNVFREFRTWKYYKGGMADDIWLMQLENNSIEKITNLPSQEIFPMFNNNSIYYLSDRERTMNLYVYNILNKTEQKVTNFTEYDIKFPSIGENYIVFENGGFIYKHNILNNTTDKVTITIADDGLWARSEFKDAWKSIRTANLSPNGERVVFSARGDVYTLPYKSGITRNLTQTASVHERDVAWSPDGKYIAYISDETGETEIYIKKQDGSENAIKLTKNADTYKYKPVWSGDSKKILFADRMLRLQYVDINTQEVTLITKSKYSLISNYSFSPDSRWVLWEQQLPNRMGSVWVYNLENKKMQAITEEWFEAMSPAFSSDGKYIVFVSCRDFKPTYSNVEWNYAYEDMMRIYLILLQKSTPSPFAPENNEVKLNDANSKLKNDSTKHPLVEIDFNNIENRIIGLPIKPSNYDEVSCVNNTVYYIENPTGTSSSFKLFNLQKKEETELGKNLKYSISANNKKMLVKEGVNWEVIDLPTNKISLKDCIDLNNMKVWVDYKQEWEQIYNESWRQMRDFFYVPNMHGVNWSALKDKYSVLLPHVRHRDDLTYIVGELIGELNIGHAYINSGEKPKADKIAIGLLGAKLTRHSSGFYKINEILKGGNWSKKLRSPLTEPGINVAEGNYIIAIDNKAVNTVTDIYELLQNKAEKQIELSINNKPITENAWKIIVIPIKDESELYYYQWIQNNIKKVADATNNEVGYIHIPDMGSEGLNEFVKYYYPQLNKKALIIDDRGNGGGNVSPMIIERLSRQITRSRTARNFDVAFPLPSETFLGPKVLLINQYSASDGDLFPYAFRKHKLGTIIGKRTWGGVIGISGSLPFIDGTELRKPEFSTYAADTSAWIIEGYGVDPDIEQNNDPYQEYIGNDQQLNKAIEVIKLQLGEYKELPPIPVAPDKSK